MRERTFQKIYNSGISAKNAALLIKYKNPSRIKMKHSLSQALAQQSVVGTTWVVTDRRQDKFPGSEKLCSHRGAGVVVMKQVLAKWHHFSPIASISYRNGKVRKQTEFQLQSIIRTNIKWPIKYNKPIGISLNQFPQRGSHLSQFGINQYQRNIFLWKRTNLKASTNNGDTSK